MRWFNSLAGPAVRHGLALLRQGGLSTSEARTGQQWDAPNGWAPLQWIAVEASRRYLEHMRQAWDAKMPDAPFRASPTTSAGRWPRACAG